MSTRLISEAVAVCSGAGFSVALVLQSHGLARERLNVRRRSRLSWWTAGTVVAGIAYVLEVVALRGASLSIVAPLIAAGILVLPPLDRIINHRAISRVSLTAIAAIAGGSAVLAVGAADMSQSRGDVVSLGSACIAGMSIGFVAIVGLAAVAAMRGYGWMLAGTAGLGFVISGIATRVLATSTGYELIVATAIAVVAGLAGMGAEMLSLRSLPASVVGPVVLVVTTVGSAALSPVIIGDAPISGPVNLLAVVVIVAAAAVLTRVSSSPL